MKINDHAPFSAYVPDAERYERIPYRRCGRSGVRLPALSLGLWHNFGQYDSLANARQIVRTAFDLGITHFDLANNYGPPYGSAEESFGRILKHDFGNYRDELFIASKAGFDMWPGPYGVGGSRKYLIASLDQSLARMGLDYVDLFYHHVPDKETPVEETVAALDAIVRQGKALYVGISNYNAERTSEALAELKKLGTPCLIHQSNYSMFNRKVEGGLLDVLAAEETGLIAFSPLAQGLLTNRYLEGIPADSRAAQSRSYLSAERVEQFVPKVRALHAIAEERGQTLAQMALAWLLRDDRVTSVLIGASSPEQLKANVVAVDNIAFSDDENSRIQEIID